MITQHKQFLQERMKGNFPTATDMLSL